MQNNSSQWEVHRMPLVQSAFHWPSDLWALFRRQHPGQWRAGYSVTKPVRVLGFILVLLIVGGRADAAVGRTPGRFAVDDSGAASYTLSLWSPPGVAGVGPQLALVYHSRSGNGRLGVGWGLAGLSAITRCPRTWAQDAGAPGPVELSAQDRFCLDGQRLRQASGSTYGADGTTYRTEIERFARITSRGTQGSGPAWFQVETRDGLIYEYGNTEDSRIEAGGGSGTTVASWALNAIRDRAGGPTTGNTVKFVYTEDSGNGTYRIARIEYPLTAAGGGPYYQVDFAYEAANRPDVLSGYAAGYPWLESKRLDRIDIRQYGAAVLRSYDLAWETAPTTGRSRLVSVTECAGSDCLPPTTFAYQDGAAGWSAPQTSITLDTMAAAMPIDTTGDGIDDLVYPDTGTNRFMVTVADGAGGYSSEALDTGASSVNYQSALPLDFDGDGRMDLLIPNGGDWRLLKSSGVEFTALDSIGPGGSALPATGADGNAWVADYSGDGRPDLIYKSGSSLVGMRNDGAGHFSSAETMWSSPGPNTILAPDAFAPATTAYYSSVRFADFNGDGRADLLAHFRYFVDLDGLGSYTTIDAWQILICNGATFVEAIANPFLSGLFVHHPLLADVNGDDLTDVVVIAEDAPNVWSILLATGDGNMARVTTSIPAGVGGQERIADVDGDGLDDLIISSGGTYQYARSTGTGFAALQSLGIPDTAAISHLKLTDLDHDGLADWIYADDASHVVGIRLHAGAGQRADLATSFTDGFGVAYQPQYSAQYQPFATGATFPYRNARGPMQVVSTVTASDGTGGNYVQSYAYDGAWLHLQGRGFAGFGHRQVTDSRDGTVSHRYFRRDFPYTGMVSRQEWRQSDGTLIRKAEVGANDWAVLSFGSGANAAFLPYVSHSTAEQYEVGGASNGTLVTRQVTTTSLSDTNYGTPSSVTVETIDQDPASPWYGQQFTTVTSHSQFVNQTSGSNWCVGRPGRTTVTRTLPDSSSSSRLTERTIKDLDYGRCLIGEVIAEPDSSTLRVATSYGYDLCGNISSQTVTGRNPDGSAMAARTGTRGHGARCQLPEAMTNALGQPTQIVNNYDFGLPVSATDPNGLTTSQTYDAFGRPDVQSRPDGTATEIDLLSCQAANNYCGTAAADIRWQQQMTQRASGGSTIRTDRIAYDGFDRPRVLESQLAGGAFSVVRRVYDAKGRLQREHLPMTALEAGYRSYGYDLLGRVTVGALYDGSGTLDRQSLVSYAGRRVTTTDTLQHSTERYVDVLGQLRRVVEPAPGRTVNYGYSPLGQLTSIDDAGLLSSWTYDLNGHLVAMAHVDRGSWSYVPNSLGELTSQTNARGQTLQVTYDLLGRPLTRVEPEGTTTWTWGTQAGQYEIGRLAQVSGPGGYAEAYDYDSAGRLVQTTITADGGPYVINRDYNSAGLVDSLTYPASTGAPLRVRYGYDHGLLDRVSDYDNPATVFWQLNTMDARGQALDETLGSASPAISVLSSYDPLTGLLESRTASVGSTLRQDLSFTWDAGGNLKSRTDHTQGALTEEFFYDTLGRLDYSRRAGVQNLNLSYDAYGNIASRVEGGGSYSYQYSNGAHPHAVSAVLHDCGCSCLSDDYAYDANGNMTSRVGSAISWSSYDLPLVLNQDGASSQFAYTPGRSRWKQVAVYSASTTETTLYLGGVMEKVTRGSVTEWKHYIPAGAGSMALHIRKSTGSPASATYYVTGDHLGSATAVMDAGGALLSQLSFAAFGSRRGSAWQDQPLAADWNVITATTRRGFTGHEHLDNLSLVHMNGRVYDPKLGRFLSADPVYGGDLAQPQTLNPYSYVGNNPLTAVDPEGFASTTSFCQNIPSCETIYVGRQDWIDYGIPLPDGIAVIAVAWDITIVASVDFSGLGFLDWQDSVVPPWEPNPDVNLEGLVQEETAKWQAERMLEKEPQGQEESADPICNASGLGGGGVTLSQRADLARLQALGGLVGG
ncbi:MAG: VCBS repeat-containing protein, partial [Gammaproteobacteria bacterium]|nr:VCBS repeat-containing protein [Gammaproteobacteria bacterium]